MTLWRLRTYLSTTMPTTPNAQLSKYLYKHTVKNIGMNDVRTFLSILFSPLRTEPVPGGTVGRAAVGGLRLFDRCNMSVRSDEAHVHPIDRMDKSIDGNTAT